MLERFQRLRVLGVLIEGVQDLASCNQTVGGAALRVAESGKIGRQFDDPGPVKDLTGLVQAPVALQTPLRKCRPVKAERSCKQPDGERFPQVSGKILCDVRIDGEFRLWAMRPIIIWCPERWRLIAKFARFPCLKLMSHVPGMQFP